MNGCFADGQPVLEALTGEETRYLKMEGSKILLKF
jgi:hypothetical protein